jgi:hypothetical protein
MEIIKNFMQDVGEKLNESTIKNLHIKLTCILRVPITIVYYDHRKK